MAFLYSTVIIAPLLVAVTSGITITNHIPTLPTQQILNDTSFVRILPNNEEEVITCPEGTYLNKSSLTCQFDGTDSGNPNPPYEVCTTKGIGDFSNPDNCRSFVSCGSSGIHTVFCPSNLLYNATTKTCDWPRQAGCCEFIENNSSRLLQNSS